MTDLVQDHDRNRTKSVAPNNVDPSPSVNLNEAVLAETPVETFDFSGSGIFGPDDFLSVLLQCEVPVQNNPFNDSDSESNINSLQKQKKRHQRRKSRRRHNRKRRIHDLDEDESDSKNLNHSMPVTARSKSKRALVDTCTSSSSPPGSSSSSGLTSVFTSTGNRDELPPTALVFSLDHVLEQILSLLSLPDLLSCRQVSHRWKSMTTSQLQKQITFHFHQNNLYLSRWHIPRNKHLTKLTSLLRKTSEPFLCIKFVFTGSNGTGSLTDLALQEFLNNYGQHIKELSLDFKPNFEFQTPHENQIMKSIQNMLLNQTPNLSYLFLDIISKIEWKNQSSSKGKVSSRNSYSPLKKSDVEFQEIVVSASTSTSSDFTKNKSKPQQPLKNLNRSLKMLKLGSETPSAKVLETVIQAAPSLREVDLNNSSVHFLLEPQNRLYFLKQLYLDRNCDIEVLEKIVRTSSSSAIGGGGEGNLLKLREITIDFKQNLFNNGTDRNLDTEEIEYQNRIVNVINQILESSADSLQSIKLEGVTFLRRLKLPQEMPKVYKLELGNAYNWPLPGQDLFPPGFSLSKIFPNLRCVGLKRFTDREEFVHFLNSLNSEPVPTVRELCVSSGYYESKKSENVLRIYTLFPNVPRT